MLSNIFHRANRKAKADDFKTVRQPLVAEELAKGWTVAQVNASTFRLSKTKSHDKTLEDRVWTLMYRMGFSDLSGVGGAFQLLNANDPKGPDNQIDVVAIDSEVAFAVECKSSETPKKFADFSTFRETRCFEGEIYPRSCRSDSRKPQACIACYLDCRDYREEGWKLMTLQLGTVAL